MKCQKLKIFKHFKKKRSFFLTKAQAAMEFLMTYGWAIMVVIVAIGAMAYFGVTGQAKFLPEKCIISTGAGLYCEDFSASQGQIILRLKNVLADSVRITNASISKAGNSCNLDVPELTIAPDSSSDLTLSTGPTCIDLTAAKEKIKGDISITYTKKYLPRTTTGDLQTKISEGVPEVECGNNIKDDEEVCDGTDLNGENCQSQGFDSGTLSCLSDCLGYNTTGCTKATPFPSDYISWWRFEENTNDQTSTNNGVFVGGTANYTNGMSGMAIALDGNNDYVDAGTASSVDSEIISVSLWIKPGTQNGSNIFLSKGLYKNTGWYFWIYTNMGLGATFNNATNTSGSSAASFFTQDQWQHVAFVFNKTWISYYKNGIPFASDPDDPTGIEWTVGTGKNLIIGDYTGSGTYYFNGAIDEVMIYNRPLTETEIQEIYCNQGGTSPFCGS